MCGIGIIRCHKSIECCSNENVGCWRQVLHARGPDSFESVTLESGLVLSTFFASVLSLRGDENENENANNVVVRQPLCSKRTGNMLLWNGEIFGGVALAPHESDTRALLDLLDGGSDDDDSILQVLANVDGPHAFCYYDRRNDRLWFGRDRLGRRSLLVGQRRRCGALVLASAAIAFADDADDGVDAWHELPVSVLFCVPGGGGGGNEVRTFARSATDGESFGSDEARHRFRSMNAALEHCSARQPPFLPFGHRRRHAAVGLTLAEAVAQTHRHLDEAVRRRVCHLPDARLTVLFSGGLDSMLIAALCVRHVPASVPIDLINVAFGKPPFATPDRRTAIDGHQELQRVTSRSFNLVLVDVPQDELVASLQQGQQDQGDNASSSGNASSSDNASSEQKQPIVAKQSCIARLLCPLGTVMDVTIGAALWFAARAARSKVVLLGNGADELFGGYARHRSVFMRDGAEAFDEELHKDIGRIWSRNLGRDDRLVASLGHECRHPFLDEDLARFVFGSGGALGSLLCDYSLAKGVGEKLLLRRVAADCLGLDQASRCPKRAIQFGSRSAKYFPNNGSVSTMQ
jgi:asparagine synthetase B (glutamine-hydrolysing)